MTKNGVGEFRELGRRVFIGELSTAQPISEAKFLLTQDLPVTMRLRVTSPRVSQRRFLTIWLEGIAVNTKAQEMAAHSANISQFSKMFRGSLHQGDLIEIQYRPGEPLKVVLNDIELGNITSNNKGTFFRILLSSWIGEIPLSSSLKLAVLDPQNIDSELNTEFNALDYGQERSFEVQQWLAMASQLAEETVKDTEQAVPVKTKQAQAPAKIASESASQPRPQKSNKEPAVKAGKQDKTSAAKPVLAMSQSSPSVTNTEKPKGESGLKEEQKKVQRAERANETIELDEYSLLVRQQYYSQLNHMVLKYQTLPRRAFQKRIEDDVRVIVRIDRSGQLKSVELANASRHSFLNKQAASAVEEAAPFPPLPKEIVEDEFSFSVPFRYRLPY